MWRICFLALAAALSSGLPDSQAATEDAQTGVVVKPADRRLLQLGAGDSVAVQVYGQPDMSSTEYVGDDGTLSLPFVGTIRVEGLSPVEAAQRVEQALKDRQILIDPHVTLSVTLSHSQRVSVLGEVNMPGRFPIEPNTSIIDLLALASGVTENSADVIYIMRPQANGNVIRLPVDMKALSGRNGLLPPNLVQGGDSVYVPRAEQFYIYGEVAAPNKYPIESGMTVIQAIARAGGITPRGSERRVDIKRKGDGGKYVDVHAKLGDPVLPDDVIRVKESIF